MKKFFSGIFGTNVQIRLKPKKKRRVVKSKKSTLLHSFSKRERFIISVVVLSVGLFFLEHLFGKTGIVGTVFLSILTDILMYWALGEDLNKQFLFQISILPFFFSFSFGLFYFLVPARYISRIVVTSIYALGLYSLFLSQNIFTVSSIRTIALVSSARIVSFVISLITYFFLANIVFSLHSSIFVTGSLIFAFSFFLVFHSLWSYTLDKELKTGALWSFVLSLCLGQLSFILWFWPSSPTIIALFLTGFFYTMVGLSHVWFDKRLFRGVLWEYVWVSVGVLLVLISLTQWGQ